MSKCPDWIFDICCAKVADNFLSNSHPLDMSARHFAENLAPTYDAMEPVKISESAESMLRFLSEIDAGEDSVELLTGFSFYRLNFETFNKKRNLKPLFGNAEEGVQKEAHLEILKRFKAYVFGLRSNTAPKPPAGWRVQNDVENLVVLKGLFASELNPLDLF